jgi:hypothetical protein
MARRKRIAELAAEIAATTEDPKLKKRKPDGFAKASSTEVTASTLDSESSSSESEPPYYPEHIIGRKGKGKCLKYKVKW